jgi:uncharacterized protein (DUF1778 family)
MPTKPKPKAKAPNREGALIVLLTPAQRALVDAAAEAAGVPTGSWMRMIALEQAKKAAARAKT